jgi:hypothetical protein
MTIALALKVNDGLVLAADSASTITGKDGQTNESYIYNVYNNANKIINLHKGLPIGFMTWGLGSGESRSVSNLAKELRNRLEGDVPEVKEWAINKENYTLSDVAHKVANFFHGEILSKNADPQAPSDFMGILIGGYSAKSSEVEAFEILTNGIELIGPTKVLIEKAEALWRGQPELISRVFLGFSSNLNKALKNLGLPDDQIAGAIDAIKMQTMVRLLVEPMPIQDVIDLAEFLVSATIQFMKFNPGANTVGGPIEIAAITRHEGFKWIKRKLFYNKDLNGGI